MFRPGHVPGEVLSGQRCDETASIDKRINCALRSYRERRRQIGVAGLGTVGAGTVKLLSEHRDILTDRCGRQIVVTAVSARDRTRDRGFSTDGLTWYEDARDLATDKDVDILVELIGGSDGVAYDVCKAALENGSMWSRPTRR